MNKAIRLILLPSIVTIISLNCNSIYAQSNKTIKIKIQSRDATATDSFHLVYYAHPLDNRFLPATVKSVTISSKGEWDFELRDIKRSLYISLFKNRGSHNSPQYIFNLFLAEPGDDITVRMEKSVSEKEFEKRQTDYLLYFIGIGAAKYNCKYNADKAITDARGDYKVIDSNGIFLRNTRYDVQQAAVKEVLAKYKAKMSAAAYNVLLADYFALIEVERLARLQLDAFMFSKTYRSAKTEIIINYKKRVAQLERFFTKDGKIISAHYFKYVVDKESIGKLTGNTRKAKNAPLLEIYQQIKNDYKGELRDKALSFFLIIQGWSNALEPLVDDALRVIKADYCLAELELFAAQNAKGKVAYNFSLPDTTEQIVMLENFKGRVVFIDFWFNGCGGCVHYYDEVVSKTEEYFSNNKDVVFITVSIDINKQKWLDGINSGKYTGSHIVNLYTGGTGSDHPVIKNYKINSYPRPLLIDRDGKIFSNDIGELRNGGAKKLIETINRALEAK